ncbi:hypothetical protein [Desulfomonile tiedjei]|uniref:Uncharacterized protein n=1 Tax=Desulfomonile tiedjei (strain ATCC 49306 / DSM 6799 / DCB-1) TaxID=706587 RepID=I4C4S8_DESTA|nr:hypothetical protein [Desulfomonile tiedjei]AFM24569.1 hypothetical protein Desti_1861 [Desulfomonile tiedjei DSM 6799]
MEIKLKTAPPDAETAMIVDEFGASWDYLGTEVADGISLATTQAADGEVIRGFYRDGALFIVNLQDAKKYFCSIHSDGYRDLRQIEPSHVRAF